MEGRVAGVFVKPQVQGEPGLPKRAVAAARVAPQGLEGDFNRFRAERKGGDLDMAVLLLSEDVLAALRAAGWPVEPGHLGENLLLQGVPYAALPPGARLRAGEALLEVRKRCDPCTSLYALPYAGPARGPALLRALVGRRGMYARVVEPGQVRVGDATSLA